MKNFWSIAGLLIFSSIASAQSSVTATARQSAADPSWRQSALKAIEGKGVRFKSVTGAGNFDCGTENPCEISMKISPKIEDETFKCDVEISGLQINIPNGKTPLVRWTLTNGEFVTFTIIANDEVKDFSRPTRRGNVAVTRSLHLQEAMHDYVFTLNWIDKNDRSHYCGEVDPVIYNLP